MRNKEIEGLCERVNLSKKMSGVYVKYERENDSHFIRLYVGASCQKTLFSGTPKEVLSQLYAFRNGLTFEASDFVK